MQPRRTSRLQGVFFFEVCTFLLQQEWMAAMRQCAKNQDVMKSFRCMVSEAYKAPCSYPLPALPALPAPSSARLHCPLYFTVLPWALPPPSRPHGTNWHADRMQDLVTTKAGSKVTFAGCFSFVQHGMRTSRLHPIMGEFPVSRRRTFSSLTTIQLGTRLSDLTM